MNRITAGADARRGDKEMQKKQQRVLMISEDQALCAAARHRLEDRAAGVQVAAVSNLEAARSVLKRFAPTLILIDEPAEVENTEYKLEGGTGQSYLAAAARVLAAQGPLVVIGRSEQRAEMTMLIASGNADFVARGPGYLLLVLGFLERRLRQASVPSENERALHDIEDFGQLLRHELNNPLTGILGNAELLLTEMRRNQDGTMPSGGQQRVETIAALAMRLRETVRRLSGEWEARREPAQFS